MRQNLLLFCTNKLLKVLNLCYTCCSQCQL